MVNAIEDIIMPESPNIHSQQTAVFYVQNAGEYTENAAGNDKKGVASFLQGQFIVENGKVRLRTEYLTDILNPMVQSTSENAELSSMNASDCEEYANRARVYSNASKEYATHGHGYAEQARKAAEDAVGIVNDAVIPIKKDINYNSKRIENLEASLSDDAFISDSSVAYQKSVPVGVAPYASVDKMGGMTYKDGNTLKHAKVKALKSKGANLFDIDKFLSLEGNSTYYSKNENNELIVIGYDTRANADVEPIMTLPAGTYYVQFDRETVGTVPYEVFITGTNTGLVSNSNPYYFTLTKEEQLSMKFVKQTTANFGNVQVHRGTTSQTFYPYSAEPIDTFTIPEEVQARLGYGKGISANYHNYIERTDDGRWLLHERVYEYTYKTSDSVKPYFIDGQTTYRYYIGGAVIEELDKRLYGYTYSDADISMCDRLALVDYTTDSVGYLLDGGSTAIYIKSPYATVEETKAWLDGCKFMLALAEPIVTDITDLMPIDNYIKVEGGGTIIADNVYEYAVPTTITYQKRG